MQADMSLPASPGAAKYTYRHEIDGLRALAVLPVILFHAGLEAFSGGYVGVDVFFVISGFLITRLILIDLEADRFSIRRFYERRARRILPALFLVVAITVPFSWLWMTPGQLRDFAESVLAIAAFSSNFLFWQESGYFDTATELKPLLHTWSLAIEEQFYVLFPILMIVLFKRGWRFAFNTVAALAVLSFISALWMTRHYPDASFYLLPTRAWELLAGSMAALYTHRGCAPRGNPQLLSLAGLGFVLIAVLGFDEQTVHPGALTLLPVAGTVLVILYASQDTLAHKLLRLKLLVGIGLISYSAYLWHYPIFALARLLNHELTFATMLCLILLTFLLAFLCWKYVEQPFRARRIRAVATGRSVALTSGLAWAFVIALGLGIYANRADSPVGHLVARHTDYNMYDHMVDDSECKFWMRSIEGLPKDRFRRCAGANRAVVIVGDSHAMNLYNMFAKANVYPFVVGVSRGACRLTDSTQGCDYGKIYDFVRRHQDHLQAVYYHQAGSMFIEDADGNWNTYDEFKPGAEYGFSETNVHQVIDFVSSLAPYAHTAWIGPWVEARTRVDNSGLRHDKLNPKSVTLFDELDRFIVSQIEKGGSAGSITYYSLVDQFALRDSIWRGQCLLYRDRNHFSRCGEDAMAYEHRQFWGSLALHSRHAQRHH